MERDSTSSLLADHWRRFADRWRLQESPGRPSDEDIGFYEEALQRWHEPSRPASPLAVLLGVTPEIASMRWPTGTQVLAVDRSRVMIDAIWPGAALGFLAVCGDWAALPLPDGSRDIVIGDGCFSTMERDSYGPVVRSVRRVLRGNGRFVMRFFTRPDAPEPVTRVFADLFQHRIGSFFALKWRLAMALHGTFDEGVRLAEVWDAWHAAVPRPEELAENLGWSLAKVLTMGDYRGSKLRYTFPTLAEARAELAEDFAEISCHSAAYELGERCPTLVLRPR